MKSHNSLNLVSPKNASMNCKNKQEEQLSTLYSLEPPKMNEQFIDDASYSSIQCFNQQRQLSDSQSSETYEFLIQVDGKSININYKSASRFESDISKLAQNFSWTKQMRLSLCIVLLKRILPSCSHLHKLYEKVMYEFMQNEYNKIQNFK